MFESLLVFAKVSLSLVVWGIFSPKRAEVDKCARGLLLNFLFHYYIRNFLNRFFVVIRLLRLLLDFTDFVGAVVGPVNYSEFLNFEDWFVDRV